MVRFNYFKCAISIHLCASIEISLLFISNPPLPVEPYSKKVIELDVFARHPYIKVLFDEYARTPLTG